MSNGLIVNLRQNWAKAAAEGRLGEGVIGPRKMNSFWTYFDTFFRKSTSNCEEKTLQISHFGHILTPFLQKKYPKLWRKTVQNTGKMRSIMERKSFPRSLPGERKKLSFRSVNDCVKTCIFSNIGKILIFHGLLRLGHILTLCVNLGQAKQPLVHVDVHGNLGNVRWYPMLC